MNTPTPRTDAAWSLSFDGKQLSAGQTARALRECSQKLETELATERARLDWLESDAGVDWQWSSSALTIRRAVIDAAMKEDAQ